jgi:hypothetical protein
MTSELSIDFLAVRGAVENFVRWIDTKANVREICQRRTLSEQPKMLTTFDNRVTFSNSSRGFLLDIFYMRYKLPSSIPDKRCSRSHPERRETLG